MPRTTLKAVCRRLPCNNRAEIQRMFPPIFLANLSSFGMTVPMFFCPVRTVDYNYAQTWYTAKFFKPFVNVSDLNKFFTSSASVTVGGITYSGRSLNGGYAKLYHDWWVPRPNSLGTPSVNAYFPGLSGQVYGGPTMSSNPANTVGWPRKTSDNGASLSPIISDLAETGVGDVNVAHIPKSDAHFYNGSLNSINVGYADGHVELHNRTAVQWQYTAEASYFY